MIIALGVMLVTSLLLVAVFTAANGDIFVSHENVTQQQAYYAALAGVQEYEYKLRGQLELLGELRTAQQHPRIRRALRSHAARRERQPKGTKCSTANPFETMIESSGAAAQHLPDPVGRLRRARPN